MEISELKNTINKKMWLSGWLSECRWQGENSQVYLMINHKRNDSDWKIEIKHSEKYIGIK